MSLTGPQWSFGSCIPHTGVCCSACDSMWVSLTVGLSNLWHTRTTQAHRQGPQSSWAGLDLQHGLHSIQLKPVLATATRSPGWEQQSHSHVAQGWPLAPTPRSHHTLLAVLLGTSIGPRGPVPPGFCSMFFVLKCPLTFSVFEECLFSSATSSVTGLIIPSWVLSWTP